MKSLEKNLGIIRMYSFDIKPRCFKDLKKLNTKEYNRVEKKMQEIIINPNHYKNLRKPLQHFKRVHIGHFILIFSVDEKNKMVLFEKYKHHDKAYG